MRFAKTIILVLIFLGCNSIRLFAQESPFLRFSEKTDAKDNQIKDIENEIISMNLVNFLSLKPQQAAFILEEAKNLKALYWQCRKKSLEFKPGLLDVYAKIKEQLEEEKPIWDTQLHQQWTVYSKKIDELTFQMRSAIEDSAEKVEGQLDNFQLRVLDEFSDCVMPRYSEGFIGQSSKNSDFMYILEYIKNLPESAYAAQKDFLAQKEINRIKKYYWNKNCMHYNPLCTKKDILKTFDTVRRMDKVSFELKKEELSKQLRGKIICDPPDVSREQRIVRLLLSEQAIHILEMKANKKNF
jgi:hypothetical protein